MICTCECCDGQLWQPVGNGELDCHGQLAAGGGPKKWSLRKKRTTRAESKRAENGEADSASRRQKPAIELVVSARVTAEE